MTIHKWFSQVVLFLAAIILTAISYISSEKKWKHYWRVLAGIFIFISFDEGTSLHNLLVVPIRELFGITSGYLYFAWIIPITTILVLLIVLFMGLFLRLPMRTKLLFGISLIIFVGGAAGLEMLSANYVAQLQDGITDKDYIVNLWIAAEEFMEIFGTSLFIYGLLDYIRYSQIKHRNNLKLTVIA